MYVDVNMSEREELNSPLTMRMFVEELDLAACKARNMVVVVSDHSHLEPFNGIDDYMSEDEWIRANAEAIERAFGGLSRLVNCCGGRDF